MEEIRINQRLSIPMAELEFRFSTSGGPGGQHANKTASQATLLFDVAQSPSLDEKSRQRLLAKLAPRLTKEGVLQISVQESRSQHQNRQIAAERFRELLAGALKRPRRRRPTRPGKAARERRLRAKKRRSQIKQERSKKWRDS